MTGSWSATGGESERVRKSDVAVDTLALLTFMAVVVLFVPEGAVVATVYLTAYALVLLPICGAWAARVAAVGWLP